MVRVGVFFFLRHSPVEDMNVRIFWAPAMECKCAHTRLYTLIRKNFGGMESEPMLNSLAWIDCEKREATPGYPAFEADALSLGPEAVWRWASLMIRQDSAVKIKPTLRSVLWAKSTPSPVHPFPTPYTWLRTQKCSGENDSVIKTFQVKTTHEFKYFTKKCLRSNFHLKTFISKAVRVGLSGFFFFWCVFVSFVCLLFVCLFVCLFFCFSFFVSFCGGSHILEYKSDSGVSLWQECYTRVTSVQTRGTDVPDPSKALGPIRVGGALALLKILTPSGS